jgi:hypothetical protein
MSQALYESLFADQSGPDAETDLVRSFACAARMVRAAHDLASDEMHEGTWTDSEDATIEQMRFAADDRPTTTATYAGSGYTVDLAQQADGRWTASQVAGTAGASLRFGADWVALVDDAPADVPLTALPDALILVDIQGREITLERQ